MHIPLYNMIIRRLSINQQGVSLSMFYLCMKYPLPYGWVGVIQGDHEIARKLCVESLNLKKAKIVGVNADDMKVMLELMEEILLGKSITTQVQIGTKYDM